MNLNGFEAERVFARDEEGLVRLTSTTLQIGIKVQGYRAAAGRQASLGLSRALAPKRQPTRADDRRVRVRPMS
jgi:hypothetical protein